MNRKLLEIAKKLNVSDRDVEDIKKNSAKEELLNSIFLYSVLIGLLSILTYNAGASIGYSTKTASSYPFAVAAASSTISKKRKNLTKILYILLVPLIAFVVGLYVGRTTFSAAVLYNVYQRN